MLLCVAAMASTTVSYAQTQNPPAPAASPPEQTASPPAAPAASAPAPAKAPSPEEAAAAATIKQARSRGYKVEDRQGVTYLCRVESSTGSHRSQTKCLTVQEYQDLEAQAQDDRDRSLRGPLCGSAGCGHF
jgi:hypothetical protein